MAKKKKLYWVQTFDTVHCCAGGTAVEFPESALTGLEVWHSLSDNAGANGSTVNTVTDLSGNGVTGTVTGSGRTLKIETGLPNLKGVLMNGTDDKITFALNANIRTVALLYRHNGQETNIQDYSGILSQLDLSAPNFVIQYEVDARINASNGNNCVITSNGITARDLGSDGDYGIQVDETAMDEFLGHQGDVTWSSISPMGHYHVIIFEAAANLAWNGNLQWFQDRNVGAARALNGVFCEGLIWSRVLTQVEKDGIVDYFKDSREYKDYRQTDKSYYIDGNSNVVGFGLTAANTVAQQLQNSIGATWDIADFGCNGINTDESLVKFNNHIYHQYKAGYTKNVYSPIEVTNHLIHGATAQQAYDAYVALCDAARNRGFTILGITTYDRQDALANAIPTYQADMATVNANILAYHAGLSELVADLAADARLSDATDVTYFQADAIHLNTTGAGVVAELLEDKLLLL